MTATTTEAPGEVQPDRGTPPVLEISYFTDPLCCWSWGFEPQIRRLRHGFAGLIAWRLRLGGMIGDWDAFSDPLNDVHRPPQMGPLWIQAATITGMPVQPTIWVHDPPASSWPSSLAVKAAGLQSPAAADLYLRRIREAMMIGGRNIAREDVLMDVARALAGDRADLLDAERFEADYAGREAREALEDDVREARFRGIGRFPSLGLRRAGADPAWLIGWRPYAPLLEAVRGYAPDLAPERTTTDGDSYRRYWGGATEREIAVALGGEPSPTAGMTPGPMSSGAAEGAAQY